MICQLMFGILFAVIVVAHFILIVQSFTNVNTTGEIDFHTWECSVQGENWDSYEFGHEPSSALMKDKCECEYRNPHRRALEEDGDEKYLDVFEIMAEHVYVPIVGVLFIMGASVSWILLLKRFGRSIVIGTLVFNLASMVAVGVFFILQDLTNLAIPLFIVVGVTAAYAIFRRQYVLQAGRTLEAAAMGLSKNQSIIWHLAPLEMAFVAYIFILIEAMAATTKYYKVNEDCEFEIEDTKLYDSLFAAVWISFYVSHVKVTVVGSTLSHWAFSGSNEQATLTVRKSLGWSFFQAWPTLAVTSLVSSIVERIKSWCENKFNMFNPALCCLVIFAKCILSQIQVFGRFVVVLHSITGKTFYSCAYESYDLLVKGGNLERALSSNYFAEVTLSSIQYVLSFLVGVGMWAWVDAAEDTGSFDLSGDFGTYFWILIISWVILNRYPYFLLWFIVLVSGLLKDHTDGKSEVVMFGMFCSGVAHIIFQFMTDIILDAVDTMVVCYAIDKANGVATAESQSSRDEKLQGMYKCIEDMVKSSASKSSNVVPVKSEA
eukprot:g1573.t1